MRSIQVNIDREHFTINPTNCTPFTVDSQGIGDQGTVTDFSSYFDAVNCSTLPFKPTMSSHAARRPQGDQAGGEPDLAVRPEHPRRRRQHQIALRDAVERFRDRPATPRQPLHARKNWWPPSALGDSRSARRRRRPRCSTSRCPGRSTRSRGCGGLPRLAFILNGQVNLLPRAETKSIKGGRLQTTVPVVPDAPIGHFHLVVFGGKHGYLAEHPRPLQEARPVVQIAYAAQNGKTRKESVKVEGALRQVQSPRQAPSALDSSRPAPAARSPGTLAVRKPPLGLGKCGGERSG